MSKLHYLISGLIITAIAFFWVYQDKDDVSAELEEIKYDNIRTDSKAVSIGLDKKKVKQPKAETSLGLHGVNGNTLEDKIAFDNKIKPDIEELKRKIENASDYEKQISEHVLDLYKAAKIKNWESFLSKSEELEFYGTDYLDIALLNAIIFNSPLSVIKSLLQKGANFAPHAVLGLSQTNNIYLLKELTNLGLDLHAVDQYGRNAISYCLMNKPAKEAFDYLIERNVSVKSSYRGSDPLDLSLRHVFKDYNAIYYVNKLLTYGAKVGSSHKASLKRMKDGNSPVYERLQKDAPSLFR